MMDGALNRRQVRELFYAAGKRLTEVWPEYIGDSQFQRDDWTDSAFEEYWTNREQDLNHIHPHQNQLLPGSDCRVESRDTYIEAEVEWSVKGVVESVSLLRWIGWPIIGDKAMWHAQDFVQPASLFDYSGVAGATPDPDDDKVTVNLTFQGDEVTLGGAGVYRGPAYNGTTGIMLFAIGRINVKRVNINVRAVAR